MVKQIINKIKKYLTLPTEEDIYLSNAVDRIDLLTRMKRIGWRDI